MEEILIEKTVAKYANGLPEIVPIAEGLIHQTYKINFKGSSPVLLQRINTTIFKQPEKIIQNYCLLQEHLSKNSQLKIPALLITKDGQYFSIDEQQNFWRAFEFLENSYSLSNVENASQVYSVAKCFGSFTKSLEDLDALRLNVVIPCFHHLSFRYNQFEESISKASTERLLTAQELISGLKDRKMLVNFYNDLDNKNYPLRIMHHDCKISNILLDTNTNEIICPVDMDTVMPGKFFSDVGDMIRTMACSVNESSTDWENIFLNKNYYKSILKGYLEGIGNSFTIKETTDIHYAGLLMTYMQSLRFLTDFLNNDVYYQTNYREQNFHRAKNQFLLLRRLEEFLNEEYKLGPY
jgi:Ser/Thr protein kinase RdoA (MazF antagonist)